MTITRRRTTSSGQLRPLSDRLSPAQMDAREAKMWARRTVADKLRIQQHQITLVLQGFFTRTLWGRLKWVLTGK